MKAIDIWKEKLVPSEKKWAKALPLTAMIVLLADLEKIFGDLSDVEVITKDKFKKITGKETRESLFTVEAPGQSGSKIYICYDDGFFEGEAVKSLKRANWTDGDIAVVAFLHEAMHAAVWKKTAFERGGAMESNEAIALWKRAFGSFPLVTAPGSGMVAANEASKLIGSCSPKSPNSTIIYLAEDKAKIRWANNLEELRADAMSIAICAASNNERLASHPLKTDFKKAVSAMDAARKTDRSGFYRWGRMAKILIESEASLNKDLTLAAATAEAISYACANRNMAKYLLENDAFQELRIKMEGAFGDLKQASREQFMEFVAPMIQKRVAKKSQTNGPGRREQSPPKPPTRR
jgi:hypothetical protein